MNMDASVTLKQLFEDPRTLWVHKREKPVLAADEFDTVAAIEYALLIESG